MNDVGTENVGQCVHTKVNDIYKGIVNKCCATLPKKNLIN